MAESSRPIPWKLLGYGILLAGVGSGSVYTIDKLVVEPQQARERAYKKELAEKRKRIEELEKRRKVLEGFVKRLKYTERRAQIVVLEQQTSADGQTTSKIRFTEVDADGNPTTKARDLTISGKEIYFDCLVATFDDRFIEEGDALKGKAVMVFRRVFSDQLKPLDGYTLDREGKAPHIYAAEQAESDVEKEVWKRFWELADNPKLAREKGIRSIHGKALYTRLVANKVYLIEMRATGEMFIRPPSALGN